MRKITFLAIFLIGLISTSGCATVKGFGKGLAEDTKAVWRGVVKADNWFDEHTW